MAQKQIRVGIVGADNKTSWAKVSHIPAIHGLPDLKLAAVATRHEQSAREAADAFDAAQWFSDPYVMIHDDKIDLITIAVSLSGHRELVLAALAAGKAVYCEAPLGRNVQESEEMANAVGACHTAIGLQGRLNPTVRRAAHILESGIIGEPLNATVVSTSSAYGPHLPSRYDYVNRASSGANLLTVTGGHTLDVVEALLGPILQIDCLTETLWPVVELTDMGENVLRETPDHIEVLGETRSGAVYTADIHGGVADENAGLRFEIRGPEGWLRLTGCHPYGFQAGDLEMESSAPFEPPEKPAVSGGWMGAGINVGEVYAQLLRDMSGGTYCTPGFAHGLHNARLMEAVARAAEDGERQRLG
jgi:predicted dehydrogenase